MRKGRGNFDSEAFVVADQVLATVVVVTLFGWCGSTVVATVSRTIAPRQSAHRPCFNAVSDRVGATTVGTTVDVTVEGTTMGERTVWTGAQIWERGPPQTDLS